MAFLRAARTAPLYPAFIFLLVYGMRRGEVAPLDRYRLGRRDDQGAEMCARDGVARVVTSPVGDRVIEDRGFGEVEAA